VHNIAQGFGLPFHIRTLELKRTGNLEQAARNARYGFFQELVRQGAIKKIATGHTRSDQAETVLYRLLRGAASAGLAGIRPTTDTGVLRPLIEVTRPQVEVWLKEQAVTWRQDATNAELCLDRNRIRHRLLPLLESDWNPGIQETLAQLADWAHEEERYWQSEFGQLSKNWVRSAKGSAVLDISPLSQHPVAFARRLIREVVRQVKGDLLGVTFAHIEAIRELAASARGDGRRQIAGLEVVRSFNWLRFAKSGDSAGVLNRDWQFSVNAPGSYAIPPTTIELELIRNQDVYNGDLNALDVERVFDPLALRNWRAGDRYRRHGHAGAEKVKRLFQEGRVPIWERHNWPVITVGGRIAWVSRFGPAAEFAVNTFSRTALIIHETHENSE